MARRARRIPFESKRGRSVSLTIVTVSVVVVLTIALVHMSHAQRSPAPSPPGEKAESCMQVVIERSCEATLKDDAAQKDQFIRCPRALLAGAGRVPAGFCTVNSVHDDQPAWSPNGGKIAFNSFRDGNLEVCVMNADGSDQTNLSTHSGVDAIVNGARVWRP